MCTARSITICCEKATGSNSMVQDKYITVSVCKKNIEDARSYFNRIGNDFEPDSEKARQPDSA